MTQFSARPAVVVALLSICLSGMAAPARAYDPTKFPGQGNRADYVKAFEISNRGVALEESGKAKEAIELFKTAISIYPHASAFHNNYANALADLSEYPQAIEEYKKAIELAGDNCEAYCSMADVLTRQKKYDAARDACNHALQIEPKNAAGMVNMAEIYLAENNAEEAKKWLNRALPETKEPGLKKTIEADFEKASKLGAGKSKIPKGVK
jgi:tetratricopeptide (TPR) repeat protein